MLAIVGNIESVGNWSVENAKILEWTEGDVWQAEVDLPPNTTVEYKYITLLEGSDRLLGWAPGGNLQVSTKEATLGSQIVVSSLVCWGEGGKQALATTTRKHN